MAGRRMRSMVTAGLATMLAVRGAFAQSAGYAVDRLEPAEPGSDWYTTESLDLRGEMRPQVGVMLDWAYRPLVVERPGAETPVLVDQIVLHSRADLVLANLVRVGVGVPVAIYQHGDDPPGAIAARAPRREQAIGDLRVGADVRLFGSYASHVRGAIGSQLHFPTGDRAAYTGDGTVRWSPRLLVAGGAEAFDWAAKIGFMLRPFDGTWEGRPLGHEVTFAVSAGVKVNDRFVLGPELFGATAVSGSPALSRRATPIEALLGGRVKLADDFQVGTAIGGGLVSSDGAPTMRVLAVFEYAPDVCVDKDGDGICASEDACPEVDGVRTNDRRTNGCPRPREPEPREPEPHEPEPREPAEEPSTPEAPIEPAPP